MKHLMPVWLIPLCLAMQAGQAAGAQTLKLYGGTYAPIKRTSHRHYDVSFDVSGADISGDAKALDVLIGATSAKAHYRLQVAKSQISLASVVGGQPRHLVHAAIQPSQATSHRILVKRRPRFVSIVWDGRQVLSALDEDHAKGICCLRVDQGVSASNGTYQPVEPIVFADGFMKTEEEAEGLGNWEVVSGTWSMQSVLDRIRANPDARVRQNREPEAERSVNPFSLSGQADDGAIAVNGFGFWDDYGVSVSGKTLGGEFGLVFDYQDGKNFHVFRWQIQTKQIASGRVQLARVRNGKETVLGTKHVLGRCDNWYALSVTSVRGQIEASIDSTPILTASDPEAIGGRIGVYARGAKAAIFDDVGVESVKELRFPSAALLRASVQSHQGEWVAAERHGAAWVTTSLDGGEKQPDRCQPSQYALGNAKWADLSVRATLRMDKLVGSAGLMFGCQPPYDLSSGTHWLARVEPGVKGKAGRAAVVQVKADKERVLAYGPCNVPHDSCALFVDARDDAVRFYVNDHLELRAPLSEPIDGGVGFMAAGQGEASFGDLTVFGEHDTDWEAEVHEDIFVEDPYMQGWASRRWAWKSGVKSGDRVLYVHKGDFFGAFKCDIPVSGSFVLRFGEDGFAGAEKAYALDVTFSKQDRTARLALRRAGKVVWAAGKVALPDIPQPEPAEDAPPPTIAKEHVPSFGPIVIHREGACIWASAGGQELLNYRDPSPLTGRSVAMLADGGFALSQVTMRRDHVLDYIFERAPRDWLKVGEWAVTNRFACDPRWSHLNGRSRGVAMLWNKYGLDGDFTLECYAGMRMRQGDLKKGAGTSYPRVGDINICVCGDGEDVFTGYNFILGSWDKLWSERWSKLWRLDKVVAKTEREFIPRTRDHTAAVRAIEVEWDPGGRAIHGAWYFLKLRKQANKLDMTFDDVPVASYADPKPLPNKHVALWTQDNSIVVARMKVSYERRDRHGAQLAPAAAPLPKPPGADEDIRVTSLTHPSLVFDFETGLQGWREPHPDQGATLSLEKRSDAKGQCLKLTNAYVGGLAGAEIPAQRMELSRVDRLEFDYRLLPDAMINLYLQLEGEEERFYFVHLTGSDETSENMHLLTSLADAQPDGKWRRASIELAKILKRIEPSRTSFVLERMLIGNLHEGYLNAGLGGNKTGATYWIDNFSMVGWGPSGGVMEWHPTGDHAFTHYASCVDPSPKTVPPDKTQTTGTLRVIPRLDPGLSYFHIKGRRPDGTWSPPTHYPLSVSLPLAVERVLPPPGSPWGGEPIKVTFRQTAPVSLVVQQTTLKINGSSVPFSEYTFQYDAKKQELTLRLNRSGLSFANSAKLAFALAYRSSLGVTPTKSLPKGGKAPSVTFRSDVFDWQYAMDYSRDKLPPSRVTTDKCLADHDFETSVPWQTYGGKHGATLVRDTTTAASGEASLKLINHLVGGSFGATILSRAFSAGQYPLVSFDYKTTGTARADLYTTGGITAAVEFTDNDTTITRIGRVPDLTTDGKWHHTSFNIKRMFDTAAGSYTPKLYNVSRMQLSDTGHTGNSPGVFYHVDNFRVAAVLGGAQNLTMGLTAHDVSGIAGYSYRWSAKPDDEPDKKIDSAQSQATFPKLSEDTPYFHVAAQDKAGNWGPVSHFQYLIDSTPPVIKGQSPAPGASSADPQIALDVIDGQSGINPASFKLSMGGKAQSLSAAHTQYNPVSGNFVWDWVQAHAPMTQPIPDQSVKQFTIDGVQDFAGNAAKPVSWSWKIDYAKDQTPPGRPDLHCSSRALVFDTFTSSTGTWQISSRYGALERHFDEERKDWCLKVTKANRGWFWTYARRGYWYSATHPMVSFDYKFPKGLNIQMVLYYNAAWYSIKMTALGTYPPIGEVPGIVADGKWRHVAFNLHEIIQKIAGDDTKPRPYYLSFTGGLPNENPEGTTYYIDNFCMFGDGPPAPYFTWTAKDSTGIAGVSYAFDQNPATEPDTKADSQERVAYMPVVDGPGLWYCHIRARDGAGNWGLSEHHPYYSSIPATAAGPDGLEADAAWERHGRPQGTSVTFKPTTTASGKNRLLYLYYSSPRRSAFHYRLPRSLDLSKKRKLVLDVYHSQDKAVNMYAQLRTGSKGDWYMTQTQSISQAGWTRGFTFNIHGNVFRTRLSRKQYNAPLATPSQVTEFILCFTPTHRSGTLLLDGMRFE